MGLDIPYMNEWMPEISKILKTRLEPESVVNWFAVAVEKEGQIVEHLNKGNSGRFAKIIFYFLRTDHGNAYQVIVRGTRVNLRGEHILIYEKYCIWKI